MRFVSALLGASALAFASAAAAAPVTVSYSPEFQSELEEELGPREGDILRAAIEDAVNDALASKGVTGDVAVEVTIVDADPNRPTMQQMADTPGLDMRSVSIGGAELTGVLRRADGQVIGEVEHRRYNHSLSDIGGAASTWTEARRAIRRFAQKIADAYDAQAQ